MVSVLTGNLSIPSFSVISERFKTTVASVAEGFLTLCSSGFAYVGWMFYSRINREVRLDAKESFYNVDQLKDEIDFFRKEIEELNAIKKRQLSEDSESRKTSEAVRFENDLGEPCVDKYYITMR